MSPKSIMQKCSSCGRTLCFGLGALKFSAKPKIAEQFYTNNIILSNVSKGEKNSSIKTFEDKGTKVDFIDLGDGKQILIYQTEAFRGLSIGAFKLGWTNKYSIISPGEITKDILDAMARTGSAVSGQVITPQDFEITVKTRRKKIKNKL